jgi:hypothetical protein
MRHNFIPVMLIFVVLVSAVALASCGSSASASKSQYGVRIKYSRDSKIEFPDFTLIFIGQRRVASSSYPRGFLYYDFKVDQGGVEKTVSWSSGAGDIGPTEFEIGGHSFLLELQHSDKLGRLGEDELVIWKKAA